MIGVPWRVLFRIRVLLAAAFLLWAGLSAGMRPFLADWRSSAAKGDRADIISREATRFALLVGSLPAGGTVGYLPTDHWPAADDVRRFYLAEYALTPRIVVIGTAPEFVIVVPEASVEDGESVGTAARDPRLAGFVLYQRFSNGVRIFRRFA
jgi:hypothetical protein